MTVVTRFAPSPTGRLHVGNIRTALHNALFALKHGGRRLDVAWRQDGDGATLSLTSDGTPLPEDFDVAASTGFGLRMIADMARRDGGRLSAENTPAGTVFTVRWPASALA